MQVGIASLYVASKCEEYYPADLKKLVHLTENSYEVQDVFDMELVLLGVIHFQVCSILVSFCIEVKNFRNVHLAVQVYVPTPADFLPRICRAALRPSKEFLETCSYLVKWNHAMVQLNEVKTVKHKGGQSPLQRDAPIDCAITPFLGRGSLVLAALPHRCQPREGQECCRYCR